jgi:predicted enzyme related to lactoylglutathione lyase
MGEGSIRLPRSGVRVARADVHRSEAIGGVLPAGRRPVGHPAGRGPEAYLLLMVGDQPVGGVAGRRPDREGLPSGDPEAHWIAYFGTDDVDKAASAAQELGGEVLLPPTDVPGMGRAVVLRDPQGAALRVFDSGTSPRGCDHDR